MTISPARRAAFEILRRVETDSAFASALLSALDQRMRDDDRALCHELVLGVLRRRLWLDRIVEYFGSRGAEQIDLPVRLALEIGLYQIRFLTRIPPSAAVNESVNLVRAAGVKSAAGFVNAVLRRALREPEHDPTAEVGDPIEKVSIETSHPRWLIERWVKSFGFDEASALAHANNQPAPTAFRLTARSLRDTQTSGRILKELESAGAELFPSKIVPDSWRANGAGSVIRRMADEGLIYLQDEGSQLLAHLLTVKANQRVLDVTAAPGSKATHTAALVPDSVVVAGDLYLHRVETMRRLAIKQDARIHVLVHDATKPLPYPDKSFDRVLLDAPCSGTGTLRRNPEIRYRLKPEDINELSRQQLGMLMNAARTVREGGRLIYSTCSVEPEENEQVLDSFLQNHQQFAKLSPGTAAELETSEGILRTWPHRQDCDGFFISCLERKS